MTLAEVALACGFADQGHLGKVFADLVGTLSGAWRRRQRSLRTLAAAHVEPAAHA